MCRVCRQLSPAAHLVLLPCCGCYILYGAHRQMAQALCSRLSLLLCVLGVTSRCTAVLAAADGVQLSCLNDAVVQPAHRQSRPSLLCLSWVSRRGQLVVSAGTLGCWLLAHCCFYPLVQCGVTVLSYPLGLAPMDMSITHLPGRSGR